MKRYGIFKVAAPFIGTLKLHIMDLKTLATADYLDIVFDNRNKTYGGYELRRTYGQRLKRSVAILYSILAGFVLYGLLHKSAPEMIFTKKLDGVILSKIDPVVLPPVIPPPTVPKPQQPQAHPRLRTEILTDPIITNEVLPDDKRMANAEALKNATSGNTQNMEDGDFSIDVREGKKEGGGAMIIDDKPKAPLTIVEIMPEFKGDIIAYLSKHLRYPDVAREANIQGRVVVRFVVNEDGSISNASIVKGIGGGCDEEAVRVVSAMPHWKPGRQNGQAVKVYFQVPLMFMLQ